MIGGRLLPGRRRGGEDQRGPWAFFEDFPRIFPYLRPYWKLATGSLSMVGLGAAVALITPWPIAIVIDTVLGHKPLPNLLGGVLGGLDRYELLTIAVVGSLLITATESGFGIFDNYVNVRLEQHMILDLRSDLFRHAQKLSLAFHDRNRTGALMFAISGQAASIGMITVQIPPLLQAFATLVGMFVVAYFLDPELALVSLSIVPFIYYSTGFYAKRIDPRLRYVRSLEAEAMTIIHEAMTMLRVIVAFGREGHEYGRFRNQGETALTARVKLTVRQTVFSLVVNFLTSAGTALVLGLGAYHVIHGRLTAGELLVVMGYISAIYAPLREISTAVSGLQQNFIQFRSALDLLDTEPEVKEAPDATAIGRAEGHVAFHDVSFTYRERERTLEHITFDVPAGSRVAIVGPTGAGKTTLISLIGRFYDPQEGRITLDGRDIQSLTLSSLRDQISIVLQEPLLFTGKIVDNIRYGRLGATDDEVVQAAVAANAHEFISALPEGYETAVGERGVGLSGGERQRLCAARAFLKDAPILILDEPTSSIDSKTEAVILDALERLMEGRTTFLIAHRLSTVRSADLLLVLDQGRLVEAGTHQGLLEQRGMYHQLWDAQVRRKERAATRRALADPSRGLYPLFADAVQGEPA